MKKLLLIALATSVIIMAVPGCGTARKASGTSHVETIAMPGTDYLSRNGLIRAWGIGKSNSESVARKKAKLNASSELASTLESVVSSTIDNYIAAVSENSTSEYKSLLVGKTSMTTQKALLGAVIIYDRWEKDETTGEYTNYIVMELKGEQYLDLLYNALKTDHEFNKGMFNNFFLESIDIHGK